MLIDLKLADSPDGTLLRVRVTPRARKDEIAGARDGVLLVRVTAPPVEGRANHAVVALLSRVFDVPRHNIHLVSGERSRDKRVEVGGLKPTEVEARLRAELTNPEP